jgi:[ribosomal protein S18]-alanine N-acetyltransferase
VVVKTELLIRRGFPGEFVSMAALAVRAWRIAARDIELTTERQKLLEARFQRDLQEIADGVLAAEKAGILAGWGARVPQSNYISDLWVDPPHHGQGIGRQILDALMAQILYKKAGFRIDRQGDEWSESFERTVEKVRMRADL